MHVHDEYVYMYLDNMVYVCGECDIYAHVCVGNICMFSHLVRVEEDIKYPVVYFILPRQALSLSLDLIC